MRILILAAALIATSAQSFEPVLAVGEQLDTRLDADFDGDGTTDIAYLTISDERRVLVVTLSNGGSESLELDTTPLGSGSLSFAKGVLLFEDLTGGTTAVASTRRYRFDRNALRMRLIGLDATVYSRTLAQDGFEISWNLLNGDVITRELRLNQGPGDAAYDPVRERKGKRRTAPVWLSATPDPDTVISELRGA